MAKYEGEVLDQKPGEVSGAVTPPVDFEAQYKDKAEKLKADYDKKVKELTTSTLKIGGDTYEIPSVLTSTPVVAAATVAGLYGAKKVGEYALDKASSALEGIKNRMINKNPNVVDVQSRTIVPEDIPEEWRGLYEKSQQNAAAKAADAAARANPVPQNYTPGVPTVQPNAPVNPGGAFTQPSGYGATTSNIPSQLGQPNIGAAPVVPTAEVGPIPITPSAQVGVQTGNVSKAVQAIAAQELDKTTGVAPTVATFNRDANGNIDYPKGMSKAAKQGAEAFAQQYPDHAKALAAEGRFGILGAGSGDNNLFNSYGSDMMKRIRDEVNQGQMVGPYINYESKVNPAIKGISPESAIGKDLAELRKANIGGDYGTLGTPATIGGKKGGLITGPNTVPKAIKAGGPAMLLMSIADAAKAAEQGKYGEAAMRSADVATDYIPMISQLKQGLSPSEAGAPGVSKQTIESAALLGSPFAQTEWAKGKRLKEKAGAGRGIAPPSAYLR